ncbi:glycosyltransferase 87 family protein [Corynebacterium liangguodongii]|uniref:glycosyltransferase 87 family protein n=1 Tax=Corynebacterium liangguodongii TaxID=2079535 RepID=UPI001F160311|nr:glycosyltransferase 87 family protein [Corynebacterium liangguodongii]
MSSKHLSRLVAALGAVFGCVATWLLIRGTDFPIDTIIYREGARAFLAGRPLYSEPMYAADVALPFIYPPFGALVLTPLALASWLSDDAAGNAVIVLSSALLLACVYVVLRAVTRGRLGGPWLAAVVLAAWAVGVWLEPVRSNALYGQINVVIMALVVLDVVPRKRFLPQGSLIGIAAAIKITPLAMLLFFLLRRDFRAIVAAGVAGLVATALAAVVRFDATAEYFGTTLLNMGTKSEFGVDTTYQSNSSIKGAVMRFFPSPESLAAHSALAGGIWIAASVATVVLGAWLMVALMRRGMLVDATLVNAVIMLLISPVSWSHHWVWLALILPVAAWRCATVLRWPAALTAVAAMTAALTLTVPPKWWFGDEIDVYALTLWQKVLVDDFVWLGFALLAAWALALRRVDEKENQGARVAPAA